MRKLYANTRTAEIAARLGRPIANVYAMAKKMGLKKSEAYLAGPHASRIRPGQRISTGTEFHSAQTPWNKGTSFSAGGRSVETRFQKGDKPHTWRPIGSLRLRSDGYLERKMTDTGYTPRDWVAVHRLVWEAAHGPIPKGYVVAFKSGRKTVIEAEITLDKLELVHRTEMIKRNTVHQLPQPLAEVIRAKASLTRAINKRIKDERK